MASFEGYALAPQGMIYNYGDRQDRESTDQQAKYFPYLGFILKSSTNNIIAFRGALTPFEQLEAVNFTQVPYLLGGTSHGKIELGVSEMYIDIPCIKNEEPLRDQVARGVKSLDKNIPCYVTGHSFGGPFAIITAQELIATHGISTNNVFMYNYGANSVGDPEFASIYDTTVPNSYRVVNTQDYVPNYPKPSFTSYINGNVYHYTHIGQEWSFTYPLYNHLYMPEELYQVDPYYMAVNKQLEKPTRAF
ncbi:MAG: lipase family protein [Symploca sp. SIO1B1]|nr:lipase family protein [Symploca sp. SIO1B1]